MQNPISVVMIIILVQENFSNHITKAFQAESKKSLHYDVQLLKEEKVPQKDEICRYFKVFRSEERNVPSELSKSTSMVMAHSTEWERVRVEKQFGKATQTYT